MEIAFKSARLDTTEMFGMNETAMQASVAGGVAKLGSAQAAALVGFFDAQFEINEKQAGALARVKGGFAFVGRPAEAEQCAFPPAKQGLKTNAEGWPKGSVKTAGGYTIVPEGSTNWSIYTPDQKPGDTPATRIHGDPHVSEKDGGRWDFTKASDFVLPDGTRIYCQTSAETGQSVSKQLEIVNGHDHVSVTGVDGTPATGEVKTDGRAWLQEHVGKGKDVFRLGGDGDDWFLVRGGADQGEITSAKNEGGSYQVQTDANKKYTVDPKLQAAGIPQPFDFGGPGQIGAGAFGAAPVGQVGGIGGLGGLGGLGVPQTANIGAAAFQVNPAARQPFGSRSWLGRMQDDLGSLFLRTMMPKFTPPVRQPFEDSRARRRDWLQDDLLRGLRGSYSWADASFGMAFGTMGGFYAVAGMAETVQDMHMMSRRSSGSRFTLRG